MRSLLAPKHWLTWIGIALLWLLMRLPLRWLIAMGRGVGRLGHRVGKRRRNIVKTNVALCFPDLSEIEQQRLVEEIFVSTGIAMIETAMSWLGPIDKFLDRFALEGLDEVAARLDRGKGVIIVGGHYSTLDIAGAFISRHIDVDVVYRPHKNPVIEYLTQRGRGRHFGRVIDRRDMRTLVRRVREGKLVWYAPDQDYGRKHAVFAPFFGVEAATISVLTRLKRMTDADFVFLAHYRDARTGTWRARFSAPFDDFGEDELADATAINRALESAIRVEPDQYHWVHRRFKTRPPGEVSVYG